MAGLHVPLSTLRRCPHGQPTHDSGPMWFATPSSCGSFIHNTLPVLTGALVPQFGYTEASPIASRFVAVAPASVPGGARARRGRGVARRLYQQRPCGPLPARRPGLRYELGWLSGHHMSGWRTPTPAAMPAAPFSTLSAVERAAALVDRGTLALSRARGEARTGLVTARGRIAGRDVVLVLTDGQQRGGTIGLVEARQFSAALGEARAAAQRRRRLLGHRRRARAGGARRARRHVGGRRRASPSWRCAAFRSSPSSADRAAASARRRSSPRSGHATMLTANALWGLTGPQLFERGAAAADAARAVMSAAARRRAGHATAVVGGFRRGDSPRRRPRAGASRCDASAGARSCMDCVRRTAALVDAVDARAASAGATAPAPARFLRLLAAPPMATARPVDPPRSRPRRRGASWPAVRSWASSSARSARTTGSASPTRTPCCRPCRSPPTASRARAGADHHLPLLPRPRHHAARRTRRPAARPGRLPARPASPRACSATR